MARNRVPDFVRAYFEAVDDRVFETLNDLVADDALIATPAGRAEDVRLIRTGAELRRDLQDRAPVPWRHRVTSGHVHASGALVEGELVGDGGVVDKGFVAFFEIDSAGRVAGLRSFTRHARQAGAASPARGRWLDVLARATGRADLVTRLSQDDAAHVAVGSEVPPDAGPLSVTWRAETETSVAAVGRLGSSAEFFTILRSEASGDQPHLLASWCPLAAQEAVMTHG